MQEVMCTTAEVQDIVSKAEERLEKQIKDLEERQNERLEASHLAVANSVSEFGKDLKSLTEKIDGRDEVFAQIENIAKMYEGVHIIQRFIIGTAKVLLAISAIGASIVWAVNQAIK